MKNVSGDEFKTAILEIVDGSSGGIKGIELLTRLIERKIVDPQNADDIDLDMLSALVQGHVPEVGVLRYGMRLDETTDRIKYFFYRRLGHQVCNPS